MTVHAHVYWRDDTHQLVQFVQALEEYRINTSTECIGDGECFFLDEDDRAEFIDLAAQCGCEIDWQGAA